MVYMRKEELLSKKRGAISGLTWYVKDVMTNEDLKQFSLAQLKTLCDIMECAEKLRESTAPFVSLSAGEVLQKSSGKIARFEDSGVREEMEEEIMCGASSRVYAAYKKGSHRTI